MCAMLLCCILCLPFSSTEDFSFLTLSYQRLLASSRQISTNPETEQLTYNALPCHTADATITNITISITTFITLIRSICSTDTSVTAFIRGVKAFTYGFENMSLHLRFVY